MAHQHSDHLERLLAQRFSDPPSVPEDLPGCARLADMAARRSCRAFQNKPVPEDILDVLCAVALASPTKSDLQQRDIIVLKSSTQRERLSELVAGQPWVGAAPMLLVFCANNRRQRLLHDWHQRKFANDHLDAFLNASADAAIALGAFVAAAEAAGLGCCPISAVRNQAQQVSELLSLPDHVFPFAGLALGYPDKPARVSMRLPLGVTCHTDRFGEDHLHQQIEGYDSARAAEQPYASQRFEERFGHAEAYGWSDDKTRQYSAPERAGFGDYVRRIGFNLD